MTQSVKTTKASMEGPDDGISTQTSPESDQNPMLSTATIMKVLNGVAQAANIPQDLHEAAVEWTQQQVAAGPANAEAHTAPHADMSEDEWCKCITSDPRGDKQDAIQLLRVVLGVSILRERSRRGILIAEATIDRAWSLIYAAIANENTDKLHWVASRSAQGFLAVPLCSLINDGKIEELCRLHVWLPDGQRGSPEIAIHSHQPFAQSWILAGEGTDHTYNVQRIDDLREATHAEYVPQWSGNDGKQGNATYKTHQLSSTVVNTGKLMKIRKTGHERHGRDMTYAIGAGVYHQSVVQSDTIHATLFFFDASRGFYQDAGVVGPLYGRENTQIRDPAGASASCLAEIANAMRSWEMIKSINASSHEQHDVATAYWKFFHGRALLKSGQTDRGMELLDSQGGNALLIFCKSSLKIHHWYITELVNAGVGLESVDDEGMKPLDYAVHNSDKTVERLLTEGLRQHLGGDVEMKVSRRQYEAVIRKAYRILFEGRLRPLLRYGRTNALEEMRYTYAASLARDPGMREKFDGLRYVWYSDFRSSRRLPRYADGNVRTFSNCWNHRDNADHIVFISYRWIHKDSVTGKTAPDDQNHTQFQRMLRCLEDYLKIHPSINRDKLGIWMDSSCINRKHALPGIAALPMILAQCNTLITIIDPLYWDCAWCAVEALIVQVLRKSYGLHAWYEYKQRSAGDGAWTLSNAPRDREVDLSRTLMTWEEDRGKILFLERQARLLGGEHAVTPERLSVRIRL